MKKKSSLLIIIAIIISTVGTIIFLNTKDKKDDIGERLTDGYGSHLQYLECTVEEVKDMNVFVTAEEDSYEPEAFKKGDMIKLNFALMDETQKIPEVSMHYPSSIKIGEKQIPEY